MSQNIDIETARRLVYEYINQDLPLGDEYIIVDESTVEKEYGWIFYHQSRHYIETGDGDYELAGNGPIIVDKSDGSLYQMGSANPDDDIEEFEAARKSKSITSRCF
jgi:hypothetical protein